MAAAMRCDVGSLELSPARISDDKDDNQSTNPCGGSDGESRMAVGEGRKEEGDGDGDLR